MTTTTPQTKKTTIEQKILRNQICIPYNKKQFLRNPASEFAMAAFVAGDPIEQKYFKKYLTNLDYKAPADRVLASAYKYYSAGAAQGGLEGYEMGNAVIFILYSPSVPNKKENKTNKSNNKKPSLLLSPLVDKKTIKTPSDLIENTPQADRWFIPRKKNNVLDPKNCPHVYGVAGWCMFYYRLENMGTRMVANIMTYVRPDCRRRGYGTVLVESAEYFNMELNPFHPADIPIRAFTDPKMAAKLRNSHETTNATITDEWGRRSVFYDSVAIGIPVRDEEYNYPNITISNGRKR